MKEAEPTTNRTLQEQQPSALNYIVCLEEDLKLNKSPSSNLTLYTLGLT
jgi:hypothetical protein